MDFTANHPGKKMMYHWYYDMILLSSKSAWFWDVVTTAAGPSRIHYQTVWLNFFFMVVKAWQESSADGDIFEWAWMPWAHNADTDPHPAQIGSDTSTFFST